MGGALVSTYIPERYVPGINDHRFSGSDPQNWRKLDEWLAGVVTIAGEGVRKGTIASVLLVTGVLILGWVAALHVRLHIGIYACTSQLWGSSPLAHPATLSLSTLSPSVALTCFILSSMPTPTPHSSTHTHTTSQIRAAHRAVSTEMNTVLLRVGSRGFDPDDLGGKRSCSAPMIRSPTKGTKGGCRASGAEEML